MKGKAPPHPTEADWARLLEVEQMLETRTAAAQADARARVEWVRAAAASAIQDPAAMEALAAAEPQADIKRHKSKLRGIGEDCNAAVRASMVTPESVIDGLAQQALGAALAEDP